jgi:hypothetical protein
MYKCFWGGDYCGSFAAHNCNGGPQTASCKITTAMDNTSNVCVKANGKAACGANEACEWVASAASCYRSRYGHYKVLKELGSKVAETRHVQETACNKLTTKEACLLAEPANTPSPSPSPASKVPVAAIVAPIVGVALLAVAGAWFVLRRKNQKAGAGPGNAEDGTMVTIPALAAPVSQPMTARI